MYFTGFIKTAMTDKIDEKFKDMIISKIPSARLGEPEDVANAVLFSFGSIQLHKWRNNSR